jgi:ribose/xylose/arabinose/galactoside ABC-type transport system permease subunit
MSSQNAALLVVGRAMQWSTLLLLAAVFVGFAIVSPRFMSIENVGAILTQSSWLVVVALGANFVLLTAGVDLSIGATMYLAAASVGLGLASASLPVCLLSSLCIGCLVGAINGPFITRLQIPSFVVTLAISFIARGLGLFLTSTKVVEASPGVAGFGRATLASIPAPLWLAAAAVLLAVCLLRFTPFGPYLRSIGADRERAIRAGVPVRSVTWAAYGLCGAFAGLGGFISFSQTSAASGAFGQSAEFLAIAACVLGGTSLFGGRGTVWAPIVGAVLITTIQNGLTLVNANPYVYPLITAAIILLAALLDSLRLRLAAHLERRLIPSGA